MKLSKGGITGKTSVTGKFSGNTGFSGFTKGYVKMPSMPKKMRRQDNGFYGHMDPNSIKKVKVC